jgi:hypothetical protein
MQNYVITSFSKLDFLTEGKCLDLNPFFFPSLVLFLSVFPLFSPVYLVLSNVADPSKGTMGSEGLLCWTAYLAHLSSDGYKNSMHKK